MTDATPGWSVTDKAAVILKSYGVDDPAAARAVVVLVLDEARRKVAEHSNIARKKMSACYHEGHPEAVPVWSAIISHLDIAHDAIRALKPENDK